MILSTQRARRWLGGALKRLRSDPGERYRPDFSLEALTRALSPAEAPSGERKGGTRGAVSGSYASRTADGEALLIARQARERFGPRFFVEPASVPALWRRLEREHPLWRQAQIERTRADVAEGIPLYEKTVAPLGADFPWSVLARPPSRDTLYPLRPHRFAFAPRTALACLYDPGAASRLRGMLEAWMEAAASGDDPYCHASNLAVIQRILALSWCWAFLAARPLEAGEDHANLELLALRIIQADTRFLEPRLGRSMRNNHLLADRFAAWYLAAVFPGFLREAGDHERRWRDELLAQTYPDGGSFEHSAHYHEFACEMGAAYLLLARRARRSPDPDLERRIEALLRFQLALSGPSATPLAIGNGTEDALFPLDPDEGWCAGSLRELYRALFHSDIPPPPADDGTAVRAYWLLGGELAPAPGGAARDEADTQVFPDSGLYVQCDPRRKGRLVFRTGPPPGRPLTAGHMHADLLSVFLTVGGRPLFVDAGTHTYRQAPPGPQTSGWRSYFAGPAAHNGLTLSGCDPLGELSKDFRSAETGTRVISEHRSRGGLDLIEARLISDTPYDGTRRACLHVRGAYWLIFDAPPAQAAQSRAAWYGFQCAPGTRVSTSGPKATVAFAWGEPPVTLLASPGLAAPCVLEGSLAPLGGWVSPTYGRLSPAPQIRYGLGPAPSPSVFLLAIDWEPPVERQMERVCLESGAVATRVRWAEFEDIVMYHPRGAGPGVANWGDMTFEGRLLWLRLHGDRPVALQWLDGRRFTWPSRAIDLQVEGDEARDLDLASKGAPRGGVPLRVFDWPGSRF